MTRHRVLWLTQRGLRHQQAALDSAPSEFEVMMLRDAGQEELLRLLPEVEVLVSERSGSISAELIAAGCQLRLIQRLGAQTWDIDLEAARQARVPVCYWPIKTCVLVSEHMVMQLLGLARRLREMMQITAEAADWAKPPERGDEDHFAYNWSNRQGIGSLWRHTVGILGFGEIGTELARRLRGFECRVLYHKRKRLPPSAEAALGLTFVERDALLSESDFVCSLLPYARASDQSLDAAFFAALKPGAFFAHCGSGAVVDEAALITALTSGRLAGAALDTYTWEPLRADDPLLELARDPWQNLILTPHIGSGTVPVGGDERVDDYENLVALFSGRELHYRLV
jgi:phosphoglycerate dehydrogenase-like enzyme